MINHISKEDESGQSELVNQEAGELDMSGQQFESEDVFTEIPNQSSSAEGVLNLEPDPFMKRLPHRHNRVCSEALANPRWKAAMNEEMKSLQKNETWELIECPPGKKSIGCRWIYTVKYKADGSIERFKARLVAKAANLNWPLQQFDVKNVFLHGRLSEKVYRIFHQDAWVRKAMSEGVQIDKVIVWVEAIPKSMVGRFPKSMKLLAIVKDTGMSGCQPVNTHRRRMLLEGNLFAKNVDHQSIEVYTDADWAGAVDDRRSTSGYFTFVGGNLVTWKSKKQNVVARSMQKAEFRVWL
ncbi:Retrovirus-related Pol polyprotein from transposon RE1 [Vitis vinifera]|uniref:Retrovirus-related Pol polyprotein from transposon RE1 n=1 Tax=Vitis vinifera TaxID=29760 RepID=A0A438FC72_VITVI|nr:Retrovirus-related Pol polyprotein from transposon RE1 [Vitis vinifera]